MRKRVYIAYTGGTIGMRHTHSGYRPEPGYLQQQMRAMPELRQPSMPSTTVNEYEPLLDSSNMTPAEWIEIARDVGRNYKKYDGFLVLHGTDTMAYTASALPFMLNGLGKPVIRHQHSGRSWALRRISITDKIDSFGALPPRDGTG